MEWLLIGILAMDLASVKTEPNLEKRSELALDYASLELDQVRDASNSGDMEKLAAALGQVDESVDLAYHSLDESGKDARNSKFYKRAEMRTRELLRRLEGLRDAASIEDMSLFEKVRNRVSEVHDTLLKRIMSKKTK